jgi:hypothetical protein
MPKLTPKQMKAAVQEFKKKFTGGFYHGSPSPNIKVFDSSKNTDPMKLETPGVTFVTRDPDFAESFLPMRMDKPEYKTGATMYPVNVNLGKYWDPNTPEGKQIVKEYLENVYTPGDWYSPKDVKRGLLGGKWEHIEDPNFLQYLRDTGHDTFQVMEGGIPNVGIFDPKNIRGKFAKFNPEDAESADFMKAAGGAIKKTLEHARKLPFVHFSKSPSIAQLEPRMYGTGIKGQEASRLADAPDIKPRSYFYVDKPNVRPEQGLGPHKYQGVAEDIYPLSEDPLGLSAIAKQKSLDPYLMSQGIQQVNEAQHLNELERLIKQAGYKGYANEDVGLLFYPTPVKRAE